MNSFYQIKEYDSFISDKEIAGYKTLPESIFHQLEDFILTNSSKDTDALELMGLSAARPSTFLILLVCKWPMK